VCPIQTEGHVTNEQMGTRLTFDVDAAGVGQPVWVKSPTSQLARQRAKGLTWRRPRCMMVIPTQTHAGHDVRAAAANTLGQVLEVIAWIILVALFVWRFILWRRRRRLAGGGRGAAVIPVH